MEKIQSYYDYGRDTLKTIDSTFRYTLHDGEGYRYLKPSSEEFTLLRRIFRDEED